MSIFDTPLTSQSGNRPGYSVNPAATQTLQGTVSQARAPAFGPSAGPVTNVTANNGIWQGSIMPTRIQDPYITVFGGPTTQQSALYGGYSTAGINAAAAAQQSSLAQMAAAIGQYANPGTKLNLSQYTNDVNTPQYFNQARGAVAGSQSTIQDLIAQYAQNPAIFGADQASNQRMNDQFLAAQSAFGGTNAIPGTAGMSAEGIANAYQSARGQFDPYTTLGSGSATQLAALSGLSGNDVQNQAIQGVLNSAEVQNQLGMGTSAIGKLASAKGMLRSGNVVRELQDMGQSLALNSIAQKRDSLLAQANLGSNAAQQVAGLYGGEQQAQLGRAQGISGANTAQAQAQLQRDSDIRNAQIQQDANVRSAQLQAAGLSAQQANEMASRYVQEQQAATDASRYAFETNAGVQRANTQDTVRANQDYLNYILGVYNAQGQVNANQQLGLNSLVGVRPI